MKKFSILSLFTFMIFSCSTDSNYFADAENKDASLITYSFYMNNSSSQAWATISGENGSSVPLIVEPKKANYKFSQWKTANGTPVPQSFGSENLSFFASWESDAGNMLGTKSAPDSLYDIIFTDNQFSFRLKFVAMVLRTATQPCARKHDCSFADGGVAINSYLSQKFDIFTDFCLRADPTHWTDFSSCGDLCAIFNDCGRMNFSHNFIPSFSDNNSVFQRSVDCYFLQQSKYHKKLQIIS